MNAIDFSPLFRTAIGFDRVARLLDGVRNQAETQAYPPFNIEATGDDSYVLTMAVAGFGPEDIELVVRDDQLSISGKAPQSAEGQERRYVHRGIAGRAFERRFVLADHLVVQGARMENGLLHVALKREVPEALKPRRIEIQAAAPRQPAIEQVAQAA
ncbi:Hsp20 family protein [Roseococcus sp. SYP-B2431]|uniref:Hsp20 family protein n=1 Tax=Roseococcus sp. SYP-B2431 TaxID=2496640 RepID=UPI00103F622A|nr:Hsp20 family protein [Roseococcus sp. SYP-B2431]TCI00940.1 Hsp20 family protein [Roseococcus sp. SYP-B2431]